MSSLLVILPDKSTLQCLVAMLVAAFFGRTYCGYKPILVNNRLQEMCQWQLMLLFLGALMLRVDGPCAVDTRLRPSARAREAAPPRAWAAARHR